MGSREELEGLEGFVVCTRTPSGIIEIMRPIKAIYEDGLLKPEAPLTLKQGERVSLLIVRHSDPKRWDLERLAKGGLKEDLALAQQGLAEWAAALDEEDRR